MNKLRISLLSVLLAVLLLLCACGGSDPAPSENTTETSANHIGLRFSFTLAQFSERIQTALMTLDSADAPTVRAEDWQIVAQGLVDDSGMNYTSYCNRQTPVTFTAAVEDESLKLINVGCGCYARLLGQEDSRASFVRVAAAAAQAAGGFTVDDRAFLEELISDLLDGEEDERRYQGVLYSVSRDEGSVMVILSPCRSAAE